MAHQLLQNVLNHVANQKLKFVILAVNKVPMIQKFLLHIVKQLFRNTSFFLYFCVTVLG